MKELNPKKEKIQTSSGKEIDADHIFWCTGNSLNNAILQKNFKDQLDSKGYLQVNVHLQVVGFRNIFAMGDITNVQEPKVAAVMGGHIDTVAANIELCVAGKSNLKKYSPTIIIAVCIGRNDGTGVLPGGWIAPSFIIKTFKSKDFFAPKMWKDLNQIMSK